MQTEESRNPPNEVQSKKLNKYSRGMYKKNRLFLLRNESRPSVF